MGDICQRIGASPATRSTLLLLVDRRRMKTLPYVARTLRELVPPGELQCREESL